VSVEALDFFGALIGFLWIALAVAVGVWIVAAIWVVARYVSSRLERRYLPGVARWSRRRAGVAEDAGPWACPACSSVNASTVVSCYHCGGSRADEARELAEATTDPTVFHRPPPPNRFDPSLYRGPGAPPPASSPVGSEACPIGPDPVAGAPDPGTPELPRSSRA